MQLPRDIFSKVFKSPIERERNKDLLYKCKKCNGFGTKSGPLTVLVGEEKETSGCDICHDIGTLYFFEFTKYPEYFDIEDFYL